MTAVYFHHNGVANIQMSENTWTQWAPEWKHPGWARVSRHVHVRAAPAPADSGCPQPGGGPRGLQCPLRVRGAVSRAREAHDRPRGGRGQQQQQVPHRGWPPASGGRHPAQEHRSARQLRQVRAVTISNVSITNVASRETCHWLPDPMWVMKWWKHKIYNFVLMRWELMWAHVKSNVRAMLK